MRRLLQAVVMLCVVARAQTFDQGLFQAPGAIDITHRPGKHQAYIDYYVKEFFPASATVAFIKRELEGNGWSPIARPQHLRDGESSMPSEWTDASDIGLRLWNARWRDPRGNEVQYTLMYAYRPDAGGLQPTCLTVSQTTSWRWRRS
jgi:hypothetical protein